MEFHSLPSSNLSVAQLCLALGVSSPRYIFYKPNGLLKTSIEFNQMLMNLGDDGAMLSDSCPGATQTEKRANLRYDRKLSYFKGMYWTNGLVLPDDPTPLDP